MDRLRRRLYARSNADKLRLMEEELGRYREVTSRADRERWQLEALNRSWTYAITSVPFFRSWRHEHQLPERIGSLEEYGAFPCMTKEQLIERFDLLKSTPGLQGYDSTGGSSGQPVRIPAGRADGAWRFASTQVARNWARIAPGDPYIHVWGHSHLFGGGLAARRNRVKRALADWVVGAIRVDAYDQTTEAAARTAELISRRSPVWVIGYTSSVLRIAKAISEDARGWRRPASLVAVFVTAETITPEESALIEEAFHAPCYVEYGSAEVGVIASTGPAQRGLDVHWQSVLLGVTAGSEVEVTTLYPKLFPLFKYRLGDIVDAPQPRDKSIQSIRAVRGRAKEMLTITLEDGARVECSAIAIVHAVKAYGAFNSVQVAQIDDGEIAVLVSPTGRAGVETLPVELVRELDRTFGAVDDRTIHVGALEVPLLSLAGKVNYQVGPPEISELDRRGGIVWVGHGVR